MPGGPVVHPYTKWVAPSLNDEKTMSHNGTCYLCRHLIFYATKVLSLQEAMWWLLHGIGTGQKREQFAGQHVFVGCVGSSKRGRSKIQKSEGITKIRCFDQLMFPSKTNVLLGWSEAGKKNSTRFKTKGDLKLKCCTKTKKNNTNLWTYSHPFNSKATNKTGGHPSNLLYICIVWFP